jgi:single-strand DNA-binding protein
MADLRMPDINSVIIVGNLIKDPAFRQTTTGVPVANFTIASNRKFKDNSGAIKEDVCFIGIVAWYKLAESCYENLRKGSAILVEGELQSRQWKTEDGFSRNTVEIKARRIQFLNHRDTHHEENSVFEHEPAAEPPEHAEPLHENESPGHKPDGDFGFGYRGIKI